MRGALALLLLLGAPATADPVTPYPPAGCAALWEAYANYFGDEGERALAARFRSWSESAVGVAETRAIEDEHRPLMADLIRFYVEAGDDQSRELFERWITGCGVMAADLPPP